MRARSESRNGTAVRVLAVHTTEGSGTAEALRDATWWAGSSHALADESGTLLTPAEGCVPYELAAWTLRSGNPWSENIELVGFAAWKRGDWLARPTLLEVCARWLADRSVARGIPLVKLTAAQYRAGGSGVIGHVDHTVGYSDGTHWDPGPDFPYDVVLPRAQAIAASGGTEEDDMKLILANDGTGKVWIGDFITRRHIADETELKNVQYWFAQEGLNPTVRTIKDIRILGVDVTDMARRADVGWARDQVAGWLGADPAKKDPTSEVLTAARRPKAPADGVTAAG